MNYIPSDCFSGILNEAMRVNGVGCRKMEEMLKDKGITDITYKRISDYANGVHTPSFERARIMLAVLDFPMDGEALEDALQKNREIIKQETDYTGTGNKEVRRTIRIKLKRLLPDKSEEEIERCLWQRISNLCGDEKQLSLYVQDLIAKDLSEFILSEEELSKDEN